MRYRILHLRQMRSDEERLTVRELETREFSAAIDEHWTHSRQIGVTGVPTFVAGGYGVVGAQPYESIEALLQQASAQPRAN